MKQKIVAVITTILKDRVIVEQNSMNHALKHFPIPSDMFLELLERVLKDPTEIFIEESSNNRFYHLFYHIDDERYLLAIIKVTPDGSFFSSMYPTGKEIRLKHQRLKKIKV